DGTANVQEQVRRVKEEWVEVSAEWVRLWGGGERSEHAPGRVGERGGEAELLAGPIPSDRRPAGRVHVWIEPDVEAVVPEGEAVPADPAEHEEGRSGNEERDGSGGATARSGSAQCFSSAPPRAPRGNRP